MIAAEDVLILARHVGNGYGLTGWGYFYAVLALVWLSSRD